MNEIKTQLRILRVIKVILIVNIVILAFCVGLEIGSRNLIEDFNTLFGANEVSASSYTIENYTVTSCENLSLIDTANCLKNYVGTFYNFTLRSDVDRSLADIKTNGGDCYDYSLLYVKFARALGLHAKQLTFSISGTNAHAVAVITDYKYGYCILDQLMPPNCVQINYNYTGIVQEAHNETHS